MDKFNELYVLNVNEKTEKKNNLTYLSWAWAWAEFKKAYPDANYEIVKNPDGLPFFESKEGYMVYTKVTAGGQTYEMWLPVMDYKNKALQGNATMFDVNKTIMRCLTKNLAMFGLGLYIYAGEDLPEGEEKAAEPSIQVKVETYKQMQAEIHRTGTDINKLCAFYKVKALNELTEEQAQKALKQLAKKTTVNAGAE